ncbi:MAG: BlaI family transcriptional regulator [Clostridiales bacterium 43-6]|nr:MAG: BlaI family transcriptional regulator [Clostridiales bacterium 43-6]
MIKLPESEIKIMSIIWDRDKICAKDVSDYTMEHFGWKKNTAYTIIKNLVQKGVLERIEPGFQLKPLVTRKEIGAEETESLIQKFYKGSASVLFSALLKEEKLSPKELAEIEKLIEEARR